MALAPDLRQQAGVCARLAEDCEDQRLAERLKAIARNLFAEADEHPTPISAMAQRDEEETMDRSNEQAAENTPREVKQYRLAGMKDIRELNMKLVDMAQANSQAIFNFARQIAAADALSDVVKVCTEHARKQFETTAEQMRELTAVGQKIAADSTAPIGDDAERASKEDG
jgi:hypothetical protein